MMFYEKPRFSSNIANGVGVETDQKSSEMVQDPFSDSLPVVELKPFTKQVWRRDRSLPDFYNKPPETNPDNGTRYIPSECLPNIVEVLTDKTESSNKPKEDECSRYRKKLHPKMPTIPIAPKAKPEGILAGFITKDDRSKTTLLLANQDENPKSFSCRKQALNSATQRKQQELKLNGDNLSIPENLLHQFVYLNPIEHYKQQSALKQSKYRHSQHSSAPSDDRINQPRSFPGNELGIMGLLHRRSAKLRLRPISAGKRTTDTRDKIKIENKMERSIFLGHYSYKPTIIERKIDQDRTFLLQQTRNNMDIGYSSFDTSHQTVSEALAGRPLTQGEMLIRKGTIANKPKLKQQQIFENLAPVKELKKRSKLLSIQKCGPDPIIIPREKFILSPVKKSGNEDNAEGSSDVERSMISAQANNGTEDEPGFPKMESVLDELNDDDISQSPDMVATESSINYASPDVNLTNETVTQTPIIEMVAKVNSKTPVISNLVVNSNNDNLESNADNVGNNNESMESSSENGKTSRSSLMSSNHDDTENIKTNDIHNKLSEEIKFDSTHTKENNVCNNVGIKRKPKVCAFDNENCEKHSDARKGVAYSSNREEFTHIISQDTDRSEHSPMTESNMNLNNIDDKHVEVDLNADVTHDSNMDLNDINNKNIQVDLNVDVTNTSLLRSTTFITTDV